MSTWRAAAGLLLALSSCAAWADPLLKVVSVQPSGEQVPENLLRISVTFDVPVADEVLSRLTLRHADGRNIESPFLPQELWSPDRRILTLLLHPGRVKTGLVAREMLGPILLAGDDVVLALNDRPLKRWKIGRRDDDGPQVARWRASPARAGTRQPLTITLDGPIDGRDADFLAVVDAAEQRVEGDARLVEGERTWTFVPSRRWKPGSYRLVVRETLEDAAGNRLGGHFETSMRAAQVSASASELSFDVGR